VISDEVVASDLLSDRPVDGMEIAVSHAAAAHAPATGPRDEVGPSGHANGTGTQIPAGVREGSNGQATIRVDRPPVGTVAIPVMDESISYRLFKRLLDIVGTTVGLLLLGPLMGLCAILIKFQDGGPVLFRQVRVGKGGKPFEIVKFRSMVVNAEAMQSELADLNEHDDNRTFKILNDPRITRVGRFMRRMSLDELPQLWNVLRGDMTLVGPRPALPKEVEMYDPEHFIRLAVKPGLTCIWQVSGRSNLGFQRQIELDLDYIHHRNIWLDVRLIVRTVPAVILGDGAA
jgi:lipopolysaccharide/colanic/teichoic acid biosynthesis glycosyltransferase